MKTFKHLIADIRNSATSGNNTIDFRIEDSQIGYWINQTRSILINQALQKRQDISDTWLQSLTCLELVEVDKSECCEITTGCKILRTVRQLPDTVESNGDNLIIRVEYPNGEIISKTTPFESKYVEFNKFTRKKARWYSKNNYIYIINEDYVDKINIVGLFEDPTELIAFTSCDGSTCFSYNKAYPCSLKMASMITDIVLKTKVYPFMKMPQDNTNDSSNDVKQPIPNN